MGAIYPSLFTNSNLHYFGDTSLCIINTQKYLLDDIETYMLEKIDGQRTVEEIAKQIAEELNIDEIEEITNNLLGFIQSKPEIIQIKNTPTPSTVCITGSKTFKVPNAIVVSLTDQCHQKCVHCYKTCNDEKKEFLPTDQLLKAFEFLKGKLYMIQLTGGEPMLHKDFFTILDFCKENFKTTLTTTGTLIHSQNAEKFRGVGDIQIPIYSVKEEEHDLFTGTKGAYKKVINGVQELIREGIYPTISSIVTKKNIEGAEDLIKLCIDLQVRKIRFGVLFPLGRADQVQNDVILTEKEALGIFNALREKYKGIIDVDCDKESDYPVYSWKDESIEQAFKGHKCLLCGGGLLSFAISSNGIVKPCEIMPDKVYSMGNMLEKDLEEIICNPNFEELPRCMHSWRQELEKEHNRFENVCAQLKNYSLKYNPA